MIVLMVTNRRDPNTPVGVDLSRLPTKDDVQRYCQLTSGEQREVLAYLHFRLESDQPAHGRTALSAAGAGFFALLVAMFAIFMQLSGPDVVFLGVMLWVVTLGGLAALVAGVVSGPRIDRRRGFTRAWLETLEKLPRESETMPQ